MLKEFQNESVTFIETINVKDGVVCDTYSYDNDPKKDLAIVTVAPDTATPKQKVLQGERTIEGFLEGEGTFIQNEQTFVTNEPIEFEVNINDIMQWQAGEVGLKFYEICYPPYRDGRYENLSE